MMHRDALHLAGIDSRAVWHRHQIRGYASLIERVTHVPADGGGIAADDSVRWDISQHYRTGLDPCMVADADAAQKYGSRPHVYLVPHTNHGRFLRLTRLGRSNTYTRLKEGITSDHDVPDQRYAALQDDARLDGDVPVQVTIGSNPRFLIY